MARHKHADVIIAWAEGEEIQHKHSLNANVWVDDDEPDWNQFTEYRVKPKIVNREGWVNVYKSGPIWAAALSHAFYAKKEADQDTVCDRVACIRIEWEEEA